MSDLSAGVLECREETERTQISRLEEAERMQTEVCRMTGGQ